MADLRSEFNHCLFHSSSALHRWLGKMANTAFKAIELSPTHGFILITVNEAPGINVSDLAHVHQLDHSTIAKTLDQMTGKDLVHRETIGRSTCVFLTDLGRSKAADAKAAWKKLQLDYGKLIGERTARSAAHTITGILDKLRA